MITTYSHKNGRLEVVANHLLLVEGRDEVNLFEGLIRHCFTDFDREVQVQIEEVGKESFKGRFGALTKAARKTAPIQAIGIVRDADEDASGAFASVCSAVSGFDYVPPCSHGNYSASRPSIGVFITPDGTKRGAIESICRQSLEGSPASQCAEDYLDCLKAHGALLSANHDKSFAHAYLASTRDPVARVGEGGLQGVWNFSSPAFAELYQFIVDLVSQGHPRS